MLEQLRYVRIAVDDLEVARRFAIEIVGLQSGEEADGRARFRSDHRAYSLEFCGPGSSAGPAVGIEVRTEHDLAQARDGLTVRGIATERMTVEDCAMRRCHAGILFRDTSNNSFELIVRPHSEARRYFPSRDAGIVGLSHVALGSIASEADAAIWTEVLGARITDRVGRAIYIGWSDAHHHISLHPTADPPFVAVSYEVEDIDAIMQSNYLLTDRQIRIVRGPGREPCSGQVFVTFEGPGASFFSYVTAGPKMDAGWRPRQFSGDPGSFCNWGSVSVLPEFGGGESV